MQCDLLLTFTAEQIFATWISGCIAAAIARIPRSIDNYVTGVSKSSQQKCGPKDIGQKRQTIIWLLYCPFQLMFMPFR